MDEINKIPIVTRSLLIAALGITFPLIAGILPPGKVFLSWQSVIHNYQIWLPVTSFLYAGNGIPLIFDVIMLYRNSNSLEEEYYPRRSAYYAYHILLSGASILALNFPLGSSSHFRPLLLMITTLFSLLNPEAQTNLFGLVTFKQKYYPLVLLALDFVQGGPGAAASALTGIITGYGLWLLEWKDNGPSAPRPGTGRTFGLAPDWLKQIIGDQGRDNTAPVAQGVNVMAPAGRAMNDGGGGGPARPSVTGGYAWGQGNRLGT